VRLISNRVENKELRIILNKTENLLIQKNDLFDNIQQQKGKMEEMSNTIEHIVKYDGLNVLDRELELL